jgi:putative transposase
MVATEMGKKVHNKAQEAYLDELIAGIEDPKDIRSVSNLFKDLKKRLVEKLLAAELDHHLGYDKHDKRPVDQENSRNGQTCKTVLIDDDQVTIETPRDRDSSFKPMVLPKGMRRLQGFDDKVISMYARGMSVREIRGHLQEIYQVEVSPDLISTITDEVLTDVKEWQVRPLERLYTLVVFDCLFIKTRHESQVKNRAYYVAIGYTLDGQKEVLGLWVEETEGAKFWLKVVTELKNRGVEDILIACVDGLKGFPEAIQAVYPKTQIQSCIVHQIRHSLSFVSWKDRKAVASDLKAIYKADTEEQALQALIDFREKWDTKYQAIGLSWEKNWEKITPFLAYPPAIRRIMYTTNAIESLNMVLRKTIKNRGHFPSDDAALKLLFLVLKRHAKNWENPPKEWNEAKACFHILFADRINIVNRF